jgi:GT2 family glycosyltransferase
MYENTDMNTITNSPKVAAILVNWCKPDLTLAAVKALLIQSLPPLIIVVDNGSEDNSFDKLVSGLPENALLILRETNDGFGAGCNAGIKQALLLNMDYIFLVNNDAQPDMQCIEFMVTKILTNPSAGIVGARIIDPSGIVPDHAGTLMNGFTFTCHYSLSARELNQAKYSWITGAAMLLSARAIKQTGFFDQKFFMYWEDADLCARLKKAGFHFLIAEDALVEHTAGTSSFEISLKRFEWHLMSQLLWVSKNYKFKYFGRFLVGSRHIIKSILSMNFPRFQMTIKKIILTCFD